MKKKVFSKLLMVALVATVGVFTSCKDYDDDINDLRSKLDGLNTSLTNTVDSKITAVNTDIKALETQLNQVKEDYAKADANLKTLLDEAAATGKANTSAIETLKQEIVDLKATDANLTAAINELKSGLADANATITSQGKTIAGLLEADKSLQKGIDEAKSQAANALAEAQKAQAAAQTNAETLAGVKADLATAQKQIADNLTSVNKKIDDAVADLSSQINVISGKVDDLSKTVSANTADITTINGKLSELTAKDTEILAALETAKKQLQDADTQAAANLTAAIDRISANETAIKYIQETTIPELVKSLVEHVIPETVTFEVAKQLETALPEALKEYMKSDDIKALVATETGKNLTLIEALQKKVKDDSIAIRKYVDTEFALTVQSMIDKSIDTKAAEIKKAYEAADKVVQDSVDAVAATLKGVQAQIGDANSGMVKQIADLEAWFVEDATGLTKIGENIIKSKAFADAVKEAVNEANGEILGMITAIHLFANQHMAQADEWGKAAYTNGEEYKYAYGYDNFDHELNFAYTIEQGIYNAQYTELKEETWNFPNKYIRDDIDNTKGYTAKAKDATDKEDETYFQFKDGRFRSFEDSILVRVSPINANLKKAKIALLNSKGEDIIDAGLIELVDVEKYTREEPMTRAAEGNETGLWVIKFKLNDDQVGEKWLKYSTYDGRAIVYAVAVKTTGITVDEDENITSSGVERYVVSEYDLSLATTPATHTYNFYVNDINISKIHNRYIETEESKNGGTTWTDDPERATFRYELTWNTPCIPEATPEEGEEGGEGEEETAEAKWYYTYGCACLFRPNGDYISDCDYDEYSELGVRNEGYSYVYFDKNRDGYEDPKEDCYDDLNSTDRKYHKFYNDGWRPNSGIDNRHLQPFLPINFDYEMDGAMWAKIDIKFPYEICGDMTKIRGFFVTLDQQFALESDNSEINSWVSYEYKNVAYYSTNKGVKDGRYDVPVHLFKGNEGTIYIKDANNIYNGDVIGFRVHAVNLDGTLFDPDGRAFYVQVGKQETRHQLSFNITVDDEAEFAYAVQDKVDGKNPIKAFNDEQKAANSDLRFFNRDAYKGSFVPSQTYRVELTWREDNPAIRGIENSTTAYFPIAGTDYATYNGDETEYGYFVSPYDFFEFWYSENPDADIEKKTGDVENEWTTYNNYYAEGNKVAANRLTNSVRAAIKPHRANRLIDGKTYKITATIYRQDEQTSRKIVNIIDIDITKNMPTEMPEKFSVKDDQLKNGAWTFYLRPYYGEEPQVATPWVLTWADYANAWIKTGDSKAAGFATNFNDEKNLNGTTPAQLTDGFFHNYHWGVDVRAYNFEEIFYGLHVETEEGSMESEFDENYYFVFTESGDFKAADAAAKKAEGDNKFKDADAIVVFNPDYTNAINPESGDAVLYHGIGAYTLPKIHWSHIDQTKAVKAGYIYRNISANLNEDGDAFLEPAATKNSTFGETVKNADYPLPEPVAIISYDKDGKGYEVKATYKCAFDEAVMMTNTAGVANDKVYTNTFEYNQHIYVGCDSAQFNIKSKLWLAEASNKDRAYFNEYLPALKLAKDKDNKDLNPWSASVNVVKNASVAVLLRSMIDDGYLWIDQSSLTWSVSKPYPTFDLMKYYYPPFFTTAVGGDKLTERQTYKDIKYIGLKRIGTGEGLLDLQDDIEGTFSFKVYNTWFHERTITVPFKVTKPIAHTARQSR